jgi:hypothetical protein
VDLPSDAHPDDVNTCTHVVTYACTQCGAHGEADGETNDASDSFADGDTNESPDESDRITDGVADRFSNESADGGPNLSSNAADSVAD